MGCVRGEALHSVPLMPGPGAAYVRAASAAGVGDEHCVFFGFISLLVSTQVHLLGKRVRGYGGSPF